MVGNVGFVDSAVGAVATSTAPKAALTAPVTDAANVGTSAPSMLLQNPRMVFDPTAGFITEYLSSNGGQVVSQTPSAISVAYLRQGLTQDGSPISTEATA